MLHRNVYRPFLADNQWASVTSTSGDAFEGGVVSRGSYVDDGTASTIAGYVFPYNASIGPGCGGIFIYSSYKFTEELTSFTGLTILQADTLLFAMLGNILFVYQNNNLLERFTDTNNLYSFGSVVLEVHGANGVAYFARGSVSVQNNIAVPVPHWQSECKSCGKLENFCGPSRLRSLAPPVPRVQRSRLVLYKSLNLKQLRKQLACYQKWSNI
jgi:hypothetical protein